MLNIYKLIICTLAKMAILPLAAMPIKKARHEAGREATEATDEWCDQPSICLGSAVTSPGKTMTIAVITSSTTKKGKAARLM